MVYPLNNASLERYVPSQTIFLLDDVSPNDLSITGGGGGGGG